MPSNDLSEDDLWKRLAEGAAEADKLPPCTSLLIDEIGDRVELLIDTKVATYMEWIKGEGADIGLLRDRETEKVVGICLPLRYKEYRFGRITDDPVSPAAAEGPSNLHQAIMNIPCIMSGANFHDAYDSYKRGHRDARHAAAELAAAAAEGVDYRAKMRARCESLIEGWRHKSTTSQVEGFYTEAAAYSVCANQLRSVIKATLVPPSPTAEPAKEPTIERPDRPPMLLARHSHLMGYTDWQWYMAYSGGWWVSIAGRFDGRNFDINREHSDPAALALYDAEMAKEPNDLLYDKDAWEMDQRLGD